MADLKYRKQSDQDLIRELSRKAKDRLKALSPPDTTMWAPGESQPGVDTVIAQTRTRPKRAKPAGGVA